MFPSSNYIHWIVFNNFQTLIEVKIEINHVILTPYHFYRLLKTWLQPKFEVSNSRNKDFGIMVPASWNSHFGVQNVKLGKIWPRRFNELEKTKLEPKFEVSISKNKETGQQCSYQKIFCILKTYSKWNVHF